MKKTKLLGSKLIENINYPRIPNVCIFNNPNDVYDAKFEEGDLLDANSIKQITKNIKPQDIQEYITSTEFELKIGEINSKISDINNAIVDLKEFDQDMNNNVSALNSTINNIQGSMLSKITNNEDLLNYVTLQQDYTDNNITRHQCVYQYTFGTYDYTFKGNELCILLNEILDNLRYNNSIELELSTRLPKRGNLPLSTKGVFDYITTTMGPMDQKITEVQSSCDELRNDFNDLNSNKDAFTQEFTYVINLDATSKAPEYAQHCQSAVENGKDNFVDIAHAYLKFYNNGGGIIGYGQFFGDTSTHGILGNTSYVNAYIFDSYNGRERLDFLIR